MNDKKDHGGSDAVVKAQIATLAQRFWTIHPRELQDKGMTREDFYIREMTALVAAVAANASAEARFRKALVQIQTVCTDRHDEALQFVASVVSRALYPHTNDCDKQGK